MTASLSLLSVSIQPLGLHTTTARSAACVQRFYARTYAHALALLGCRVQVIITALRRPARVQVSHPSQGERCGSTTAPQPTSLRRCTGARARPATRAEAA